MCTVLGMFDCIKDVYLTRVTHLCDETGDVACRGGQSDVSWFTV